MQYKHFYEHNTLITVVKNDRHEIFAIKSSNLVFWIKK